MKQTPPIDRPLVLSYRSQPEWQAVLSLVSTSKEDDLFRKTCESTRSYTYFCRFLHTSFIKDDSALILAFSRMSENDSQPSLNDIIVLNVGGTRFETTRQTLLHDPFSMLGRMFDPKSRLQPGIIFIKNSL